MMKYAFGTLVLVPLLAVKFLSAQALIIPQAPDGAGWKFTLVVTNTTTAAASASITFFQNIDTAGDTASWVPPLDANVASLEVPSGSSVFVHSSGTAATLTQGWAQVTSNPPGALQAFVIYTYSPLANRVLMAPRKPFLPLPASWWLTIRRAASARN